MQPTSPIEEVAATGWGDEFEDDKNHNSTKIIVLEDDETDSSEPEWENPFATKHELPYSQFPEEEEEELPYSQFKREVEEILANESCFHLDEDEELPYPKFKREVERIMANEVAYPTESSTSVYNPPEVSVMGPPVYPPSAGNYRQYDGSQFQPKGQKGFKGDYGSYHNQQWSLPPAYAGTGALLVLIFVVGFLDYNSSPTFHASCLRSPRHLPLSRFCRWPSPLLWLSSSFVLPLLVPLPFHFQRALDASFVILIPPSFFFLQGLQRSLLWKDDLQHFLFCLWYEYNTSAGANCARLLPEIANCCSGLTIDSK
ncbi:hypothetical protein Tco_1130816, partial [Tanacetum coccineum]